MTYTEKIFIGSFILYIGIMKSKKQIRRLFDMRDVIYDREWLSVMKNIDMYYIYREFYINKNDMKTMKEHGLRYDITLIPPRMLGCEFVKTAGHYHSTIPGTDITFPEIYDIKAGDACFILQRTCNDRIEDVMSIKAKNGDKVIIPPGYGHLTVNVSNKVLKMSNWVAIDAKSIYSPIKEKGGAAYLLLKDGFIKNPRYTDIPEIRIIESFDLKKIGIEKEKDMYEFIKDLNDLEFLTRPQKYIQIFEELYIQ